MKKKVLILSLALSVFGVGVVSAASVWGTYKGNNIIRITTNGATVQPKDVPAISYNGRTMIPISMLTGAGVAYTWDQKNQTVDIIQNKIDVDSIKEGPISWLKLYYRIANEIKNMQSFSQSMTIHFYSVGDVRDDATASRDTSSSIKFAEDGERDYIDQYSELKKRMDAVVSDMQLNNMDVSNIKQATELLGESLNRFEKGLTAIKHYVNTRSQNDLSDYYDEMDKALSANGKASDLLGKENENYYQIIMNYK